MTENIKCQKEPTLHTLSALKWMWFCSSALLKRLYSNKHVFGLWDEIREPEGKPHVKNMQTVHRKAQANKRKLLAVRQQ